MCALIRFFGQDANYYYTNNYSVDIANGFVGYFKNSGIITSTQFDEDMTNMGPLYL